MICKNWKAFDIRNYIFKRGEFIEYSELNNLISELNMKKKYEKDRRKFLQWSKIGAYSNLFSEENSEKKEDLSFHELIVWAGIGKERIKILNSNYKI